ncbi:MAG: DUF2851 family protein [Puia sp.]|nr:DUF2851 family protein [Puia sp.]
MTERLLQFIWQFRYFNLHELRLETGEPLRVLFPGISNPDQGADFLDARIRIDTALLAGNIELHVKASDWTKHGHGEDRNYQPVILHVVWENDLGYPRLPTLVLWDRVAKWRLSRFEEWRKKKESSFIACEKNAHRVAPEIWQTWKEELLVARLKRKSARIQAFLQENRQHWEQVFWWLLARNFGLRVNCEAFEAIARSLPLSLIRHHAGHLQQLEALLLGQAGLLEKDPRDEYARNLQREYRFLRHKYRLEPVYRRVFLLRMRPGNFPAVRLAQLASLLLSCRGWLVFLLETDSVSDLRASLQGRVSSYWDHHYSIDTPSSGKPKHLSAEMADSILINTMAPMLFAYGHLRNDPACCRKAIRWLQETGREKNKITRAWEDLGVVHLRAADSQALLECKTHHCDPGHCLECMVGRELLRRR